MNFGQFVYEVLSDLKEGIDRFNHESETLNAGYPDSVKIEHSGVSIVCNLTTQEVEQ